MLLPRPDLVLRLWWLIYAVFRKEIQTESTEGYKKKEPAFLGQATGDVSSHSHRKPQFSEKLNIVSVYTLYCQNYQNLFWSKLPDLSIQLYLNTL